MKKTRKKVFVEDRSWNNADEAWQRYYGRVCVVLDRAELERAGSAWSRRKRNYYYTTPWQQRRRPAAPECLRVLGVTQGATEQEIKHAYRQLVWDAHPDTGGSQEAFVALQRAYEQALAFVSNRSTPED